MSGCKIYSPDFHKKKDDGRNIQNCRHFFSRGCMGLEIEIEDDGTPPIFTGMAIKVRLPDLPLMSPQGKQIIIQGEPQFQPFWVTTFPDWVHKVFLGTQELDVLGSDLQKDMMIVTQEGKWLIKEIDKEVLYHGMMMPQFPIGQTTTMKVPRYEFTQKYFSDGHIEWEWKEISDKKSFTK